jgi:hypothetical protein
MGDQVSERGEKFDAAVVTYEAVQQRLLDLTEQPCKDMPVDQYRALLKDALKAQQRAHKAVMAAWRMAAHG